MKLSDAIRIGCKSTEPAVGNYILHLGYRTSACAMGAAGIGLAGSAYRFYNPRLNIELLMKLLKDEWPDLNKRIHCPVGSCVDGVCVSPCVIHTTTLELWDVITHLNDAHHWTRETIAGWLDEFKLGMNSTSEVAEPHLCELDIR